MTDAALLRLPRQVIALVDTQTDADERDGDGEENLDIPHRFSQSRRSRCRRRWNAPGGDVGNKRSCCPFQRFVISRTKASESVGGPPRERRLFFHQTRRNRRFRLPPRPALEVFDAVLIAFHLVQLPAAFRPGTRYPNRKATRRVT